MKVIFKMMRRKLFSVLARLYIFKKLLIAVMFQRGNQKGCLVKVFQLQMSANSLAPALNYINTKSQVKFDASC